MYQKPLIAFCTFILCLTSFCVLSQSSRPYTEVSLATPNAAALGKYADVPVNNHTGIPSIEVPIYTVQEGSLALPISLSYHAGGVKVMEPASWTGIGWSLQAGGMIARTVRGTADERNAAQNLKGHFSDYGYSNYLTQGGVMDLQMQQGLRHMTWGSQQECMMVNRICLHIILQDIQVSSFLMTIDYQF